MNGPSDYWVTFLVEGIGNVLFPRDPWPYGRFEFSQGKEPFANAEKVLGPELARLDSNAGKLTKMRTYVRDVSDVIAATREAREHADETLALMRLDFLYSYSPVLTNVGCVFDLRRGAARPLPPPARARAAGLLAIVDDVPSGRTALISLLLATDGTPFGELGRALRRSAHWRNVARATADKVQYVLMTWMACEVLCKVSETDSVTDRILAAVGLVRGRHARALRADDIAAFKNERAKLAFWRRELFRVVDNGRRLRNAIVHSGYRDIEMRQFLSDSDMVIFKRFMTMALPRLQGMALRGLQLRLRCVRDMWADLARVLYDSDRGVAIDLLGNVIHMMENPSPYSTDG